MPRQLTDAEIETSFLTFAREVLKLNPYPWQDRVLEPFDHASAKLVQVTCSTPNFAGKSSIIIPTLVLGWLSLYQKGRVALTTADGKQIDNQVMPAILNYANLFEKSWTFNKRRVENGTGGFFFAFSTDDPGNVEGAHKIDNREGPLLAIVDEAKSLDESIFMGIDRWTYNGILLTSSPGPMSGRFYDSHYKTKGFIRIKAGLADCPHITQDKIDRLMAVHGPDGEKPNPSFLASTLHGEFMEAEGELRFNREGLDLIRDRAIAFEKHWRSAPELERVGTLLGELHKQPFKMGADWISNHESGWCWRCEAPIAGCRYIGFCDPTTGVQSAGALKRDTHGVGILRLAYTDPKGIYHDDEVVAVLHHEGGCRWDNDIMTERFALLLKYYECPAIVEANNYGGEVMRLLLLAGCNLWRRHKRDHKNPGKLLETVGFLTTAASKNEWVGALSRSIREQTLVCNYLPAAQQFCTFILNEKGAGEAQGGCFDDFVTGIGLALYARESATPYPIAQSVVSTAPSFGGCFVTNHQQAAAQTGHGACS